MSDQSRAEGPAVALVSVGSRDRERRFSNRLKKLQEGSRSMAPIFMRSPRAGQAAARLGQKQPGVARNGRPAPPRPITFDIRGLPMRTSALAATAIRIDLCPRSLGARHIAVAIGRIDQPSWFLFLDLRRHRASACRCAATPRRKLGASAVDLRFPQARKREFVDRSVKERLREDRSLGRRGPLRRRRELRLGSSRSIGMWRISI